MTSEHHGGFAGYMAQPLQMASFVLEESTDGLGRGGPLLLPLRSTALVAEEVAWLQARHPGRVGLGVAAGALPLDFEVAGVQPGRCGRRASRRSCPGWPPCCGARSWASSKATRPCWPAASAPVPVLSAAVSVAAAVRAARCGAGILMEGMSDAGQAGPSSPGPSERPGGPAPRC